MSMSEGDGVNVGEFRQRAAELIRAVEEAGVTVIIARRGRPVAQLRPLTGESGDLSGTVQVTDGVDLTDPVVDPGEWATG